MQTKIKGAWNEEEISRFLGGCKYPIRLAVTGPGGFPRVVSLWFRHENDRLLCVTHQDSFLARLLREDGRVGFEISPNEPPYMGVRGHGEATLEPLGDRSTLSELLENYLGGSDSRLASWLLSRSEEELVITVTPHSVFSWDYRERMENP
jgi:nitroimidazol reductase NimA-like FMN-containing flavoprotein (pyridoxamine 5'-phosphate oxidase superfamily)